MMKVTVFKQKPYSEEYTNPLGVKTFRTMEYPPNHVDVELVLDIIRQEKLKPGIDTIRSFYDTDTQMYSELKGKLPVCLFAGIFGRFSNAAFITPSHSKGYLSKSFLKFSPGSLACKSLIETPCLISCSNNERKGIEDFPCLIYKSFKSAVPIHKVCFTLEIAFISSV